MVGTADTLSGNKSVFDAAAQRPRGIPSSRRCVNPLDAPTIGDGGPRDREEVSRARVSEVFRRLAAGDWTRSRQSRGGRDPAHRAAGRRGRAPHRRAQDRPNRSLVSVGRRYRTRWAPALLRRIRMPPARHSSGWLSARQRWGLFQPASSNLDPPEPPAFGRQFVVVGVRAGEPCRDETRGSLTHAWLPEVPAARGRPAVFVDIDDRVQHVVERPGDSLGCAGEVLADGVHTLHFAEEVTSVPHAVVDEESGEAIGVVSIVGEARYWDFNRTMAASASTRRSRRSMSSMRSILSCGGIEHGIERPACRRAPSVQSRWRVVLGRQWRRCPRATPQLGGLVRSYRPQPAFTGAG